MKRITGWFRKILGITALEAKYRELLSVYKATLELQEELNKNLRIDCDMGIRGPSSVILTGAYRGRGYVQVFEMDNDEFARMVDMYRDLKKRGIIRNIDAPPQVLHYYNVD